MSQFVNSSRTYTRGNILEIEEDRRTEFKGHRTITIENRKNDANTGELLKTRQQWSKYLCGMLNSGFGGKLYGGILDNGEVNGFMMSPYQMDHVLEQLNDMFKRFTPPVPKHLWKLEFIPQLEPFDEKYVPDPVEKIERLEKLDHKLRTPKRCWCDNEAAASHSFGILLPWYIIEVTIEEQKTIQFKAEDGEVYERGHGMTITLARQEEACHRCGAAGHRARSCPQPSRCFRCGEAGHQAARCPRNQGVFTFAKPGAGAGAGRGQETKYCHNCETPGHGVTECPELFPATSPVSR